MSTLQILRFGIGRAFSPGAFAARGSALVASLFMVAGAAFAAERCTDESGVKKPLGEIRVFVNNDASYDIYGGSGVIDDAVTIKPGATAKVQHSALELGDNEFTIYVLARELVDGFKARGDSLEEISKNNAYPASFKIVGTATDGGKGQNYLAAGASVHRYLKCRRDWSNDKNRWNITVTRR